MESHTQLDPARGATVKRLACVLFFLLFRPIPGFAQLAARVSDRAAEVKQMYDAGRWSEVVEALPDADNANADLQMYRGLALARLERWDDARKTFEAGAARYPRDPRFLVELGGIAYRQKAFPQAERALRRAPGGRRSPRRH